MFKEKNVQNKFIFFFFFFFYVDVISNGYKSGPFNAYRYAEVSKQVPAMHKEPSDEQTSLRNAMHKLPSDEQKGPRNA